jgi:hypothetical protein
MPSAARQFAIQHSISSCFALFPTLLFLFVHIHSYILIFIHTALTVDVVGWLAKNGRKILSKEIPLCPRCNYARVCQPSLFM